MRESRQLRGTNGFDGDWRLRFCEIRAFLKSLVLIAFVLLLKEIDEYCSAVDVMI